MTGHEANLYARTQDAGTRYFEWVMDQPFFPGIFLFVYTIFIPICLAMAAPILAVGGVVAWLLA